MSNNDVFGEAKFGGQKHTHKFPKEGGSLVLRILPPVGSLKATGRWNQYYAIHFGYRDSAGKLRPFQSCEVKNRTTRMIEVMDPAQERITKLKSVQDKAKVEGNTELVKKISEQLRVFNLKKAYYVNAMDLNGKIGTFSIPYKMKMMLDDEIKKLQAKGVNPLAVTGGRFFVFTRTGTGPTTSHSVQVYKEDVMMNGQQVSIEKVSDLTPDVGARVLSEGSDLGNLYIAPSPEDIEKIVKGDGSVLEAVFDKYRGKTQSEEVVVDDSSDYEEVLDTPVQAPKVDTAPSAAMKTAVQEEVVKPVASAGSDIAGMSNEDFLKLMGV